MSESHNLTSQRWQCSVCTNCFPTKRHVATHYVRAHPSSSSKITSDDDEEEDNNPHQCSYCDRSLPSMQGLRNHERQFHQAAVSASLAQPAVSQKMRANWTEQEVERFKEAATSWGLDPTLRWQKLWERGMPSKLPRSRAVSYETIQRGPTF